MVTNNAWNSQDPAQVTKGGTGDSSFTAYAPVCGGTATTSPLQSATTGFSTVGSVLTSNGNAALPSWQVNGGIGKVIRQVFTGSGTYTPSAGLLYADVECVGGGGGGGGANPPSASFSRGSGGGGGGYCRKVFSSATLGVSQSVTIGAGGTGGVGASTGATGGTTSFGALLSSTGGVGGVNGASIDSRAGGDGGAGSGGDFNTVGCPGGSTYQDTVVGACGGNSFFGGGANLTTSNPSPALNATSYGGGGGGPFSITAGTYNGGNGFAGVVIVTEYTT